MKDCITTNWELQNTWRIKVTLFPCEIFIRIFVLVHALLFAWIRMLFIMRVKNILYMCLKCVEFFLHYSINTQIKSYHFSMFYHFIRHIIIDQWSIDKEWRMAFFDRYLSSFIVLLACFRFSETASVDCSKYWLSRYGDLVSSVKERPWFSDDIYLKFQVI